MGQITNKWRNPNDEKNSRGGFQTRPSHAGGLPGEISNQWFAGFKDVEEIIYFIFLESEFDDSFDHNLVECSV